MQEENSWHGRLSQPTFLKHLNKTHQGIMCETEIKISQIKKHVYRERKETTHVEIGEETHISSYIYENKVQFMSINGHKTSIQEDKERKVHKNLTTSFKKYTHSPYQKSPILTLPLSTRLLSIQNYSPFL